MNYWVYMLTIACIYVGLATSLNLVSGYTGILSVCQAAFFGIGAYASALLTLNAGWPWLATLPVAVVLAIGPAAIVGSLALRLKNDYLIVATFAVQVILVRVMQSWFQVTQGELGVSGVPPVRVGSWVVDTSADGLLLAVLVTASLLCISWRLVHSPFGRLLRGIREDEPFVSTAGKQVGATKLTIFIIGAVMASVSGATYAPIVSHIDPTSFHVMESVFILALMIIGGAGTFWGPVVGALTLVGFQAVLRFTGLSPAVAANVRQMAYGLLLVVSMVWRPEGLLGSRTSAERKA